MARKFILAWSLVGLFALTSVAQPSFANLSVLLAKGYFQDHISENASLKECVEFLNQQGVYFSFFDVLDQCVVVTQEDVARVMGQCTLVFLDEAEVVAGSIKRPDGIRTWVDYCLLNDVDVGSIWNGFLQRTKDRDLPEVVRFFGNGIIKGVR